MLLKYWSASMPSLDHSLYALLVGLFLCGCDGSDRESPGDMRALEIEVTGEDRRWTARYPGPDGRLQTPDDVITPGEVMVPAGVPVTLHLRSKDRLYLFALPHENLREIAVPDLEFQLRVLAGAVGDFPLIGGELCGRPNTKHGTFLVRSPEDFIRHQCSAGFSL